MKDGWRITDYEKLVVLTNMRPKNGRGALEEGQKKRFYIDPKNWKVGHARAVNALLRNGERKFHISGS